LDAVLRNIADGLVVTDRQERVILTNPVFDAIADQPGSALLGQPIGDLMYDPLLVTLVQRALEHPREVQDARVVLETRIYKASACALRGNGLPSGVVTVLRDVTHEVEVDRMKTEFIASVSHELRTPLTSILGFAKLIRRSFDRVVVPVLSGKRHTQGAAQRIGENLDIIAHESERLTRLINDVLDIAKMEAGKVEWHDQPLDLPALIQRAVDGVQGLAAEKGLAMRVQTAKPLPAPVADPDRILQVLTNLLSNSIKFTERGEVRVAARPLAAGDETHGWQAPGGMGGVVISVADTGVGIPAAELPRLFQRFRQVTGDTLTDKPQGTGLGLAICREIVSHYGGTIWAESTPGIGSIFYFALPLAPVEVPGVETALPTRPRAPEVRPPEDRKRLILVVDDEENIRNLLRQELTEAGYQVIEAAGGAEALHRARQEKPALITLDLLLPDISGFDVTSALKADQATADIPILILSIVEDQEKGLRLGADAYLTKPLDTAQLLRSIATLLTRTERGGR
jgi:signal transduction histidine kinase/CheY-like chemotaxis protein